VSWDCLSAASDWRSSFSNGPGSKSSYRGIETNNLLVNRSPVASEAVISKVKNQPSSPASLPVGGRTRSF
jgi:hypothetical protein